MTFILGTLTFPLAPEKFTLASGARVQTYQILDLGNVSFPRGREPQKISFDGLLPGTSLRQFTDLVGGDTRLPWAIARTIDGWVAAGTDLLFTIPEVAVLLPHVFVETFSWTPSGGLGDIAFSIQITEKRPLTILTTGSFTTGSSPFVAQGLPTPPAIYVPAQGETLLTIAKKLYGDSNLWNIIYQANAALIGPDYTNTIAGLSLVIPGGI